MRVWTRLEKYRANSRRPLVLALGNFDGVHLGHQRILRTVVERAREQKGLAAVFTFLQHPQRVLHHSQDPPLLSSPQHRLLLFHELGVEVCFLLHFTLRFSQTSPTDFVVDWLVKRLRVKEVHLGYNAHFGCGRKGDSVLMKELAQRHNFGFFEAESVQVNGEFVSSSLIRRLVASGDLIRVRQLLGRPFSIFATVVRGKHRGRVLGFPTANLKLHSEILPPHGVYPVEVRQSRFHLRPIVPRNEFEFVQEKAGCWRQGILNYGVRPTFESSFAPPVPEVHLFDFEGNLYGETIEVLFHPGLREEKRFRDAAEFRQAVQEDIAVAREYFLSITRSH